MPPHWPPLRTAAPTFRLFASEPPTPRILSQGLRNFALTESSRFHGNDSHRITDEHTRLLRRDKSDHRGRLALFSMN